MCATRASRNASRTIITVRRCARIIFCTSSSPAAAVSPSAAPSTYWRKIPRFSYETDPWQYAWLGFRGTEAKALIDATLPDGDVFEVPAELIYELEAVVKTAMQATDMVYALTGLCYKILGRMRSERAPKPQRPDIVKSATRFIEYNYFRPFDVTGLAEELGMSRAHFTTVFTATMGVSPYNYLTRYRISKAESLLKADDGLSITEIAYSVGFSSIERFSEMFKKYAGVSPLVYKKNIADSTK